MPTYSGSIEIAAPPEAVFARVADLESHADWSVDPLQIEAVGEGRYRSSVRAKGKTIAADIHVVEQKAPERVVFDVADATGAWRHIFTLSPTANGTRVTRAISGRLSAAQLLLYGLVVLPIKRPNNVKSLRKLKRLMEAG